MVNLQEVIDEKYGVGAYDDQDQATIDQWVNSLIEAGDLVSMDGYYWLFEEGITENLMEKEYRKMLDEDFEPIKIAGLSYGNIAQIFEEVDPTAYKEGFDEYVQSRAVYHSGLNLYFLNEECS
jgi:hypothetical protein